MAGTGQSTPSLSGLTMLLSITQQLRCQPRPGHQNASPSPLSPHKTQWSAAPLTMGGVKVRADTRDESAPSSGFVAAYLHHITMGVQVPVQAAVRRSF